MFVAAIVGAGLQMTLKRWQASRILSRLNGKHVLITGGSQGIGRSMAALCCRYGADVTLFARDPIKLHETKAQLVACHRLHDKQKLNCFSVDVTSPEQVDKTMLYMAEHFDAVDILINCAGNSIPGSVDETSLDIYDRMMAVNYFGSLYTTKSLIPLMKQRQSGHIVFVSSIAGLFGMYGFSAYSAAKFAVIGLAESLHMELKEHGVAVTVVLPPDTDTPGFEQEQLTKVSTKDESVK